MNSSLVVAMAEEMRLKLDKLLWEIELWRLRHYLTCSSKEELEREWFFNEILSGVFDSFYYFGRSCIKPVSEISPDDICPPHKS